MAPLRSDREWIYWGERDPLYSVVTRAGREAGGLNPWTAEEFLETGRRYFAYVLLHWTRYGVGSRHCVEIGCGAGRITHQLLDQFANVTALDVSPAQIERAKLLLGERAGRTRFALVSETLIPIPDALLAMASSPAKCSSTWIRKEATADTSGRRTECSPAAERCASRFRCSACGRGRCADPGCTTRCCACSDGRDDVT